MQSCEDDNCYLPKAMHRSVPIRIQDTTLLLTKTGAGFGVQLHTETHTQVAAMHHTISFRSAITTSPSRFVPRMTPNAGQACQAEYLCGAPGGVGVYDIPSVRLKCISCEYGVYSDVKLDNEQYTQRK